MDRNKRILCLVLCVCFFLTALACDADPAADVPTEQHAVNVIVDAETAAPATQEPAQTPTPAATPFATRAPIEGDVCTDRFPDYDTGTDAEYSYQTDEIRIAIKRYEDADFCQVYYVADVWLRNISAFRTGFGYGAFNAGHEYAEDFATREHAVLAINGSFNKGLVIHNREKVKGADNTHEGVMFLYEDGTMQAIRRSELNLSKEEKKGIVHAWQFGPVLVHEGKPAEGYNVYGTRHSRIIIGYYEPGHYVAVAVDGRRKDAVGMNNYEMVELMHSLGCQEAMNLDGGTSAIMTFMGKIINDPPGDDKDGDGKGGRNLVDMLLFAEYDANGDAPALDTIRADKFLGN